MLGLVGFADYLEVEDRSRPMSFPFGTDDVDLTIWKTGKKLFLALCSLLAGAQVESDYSGRLKHR